MDNLTHGLVGAAIGKAGAERATPLATVTLVVAANAPDIDVLSYAKGEYFALSFRRGITHGVPALVVLPFVVVAAMLAYDRWVRRRRDPGAEPARAGPLLALSAAGVVTHPTLDWMNTYGMRWGLPLDSSWTYGDALFIIDPWIWLVLGGAVFFASRPSPRGMAGWALLALLASLPILAFPLGRGAKVAWVVALLGFAGLRVALARRSAAAPRPDTAASARIAGGGLAAVTLYILLMVAADLTARSHVRAEARALGLEVQDLMVAPSPANPLRAEVEVLTVRGYVPGEHRWLDSPRVRLYPEDLVELIEAPAGMAPALAREVVEAGRRDQEVSRYLVWSRYPYARVRADGAGWRVTFSDARYDGSAGAGGLSGLTVTVPEGSVR